ASLGQRRGSSCLSVVSRARSLLGKCFQIRARSRDQSSAERSGAMAGALARYEEVSLPPFPLWRNLSGYRNGDSGSRRGPRPPSSRVLENPAVLDLAISDPPAFRF